MSRKLQRQEWWDHRREMIGTLLLYACFLVYVGVVIYVALNDLSWWWLATIVIPAYVAVTIKGDV